MTEPPRPPGEDPTAVPPPDPMAPPPAAPSFPPAGPPPEPAAPPPPGGYAPPPGEAPGGYQQPGYGYAPPGPQAPPPGYANSDEKTFALIAHFGGAVGSLVSFGVLAFVGPLIAYLAKGQQSPTIRAHAVAALNFQVLWSIVGFVGVLTSCILIGWLAVIGAMAMSIIFGVIAGMKANEGQFYRYPGSPSFIK